MADFVFDLSQPYPDVALDTLRRNVVQALADIADHVEQLADSFLLGETSADFAQTFLNNVLPLQHLVTALAAANPRTVTDAVTAVGSDQVTSATAQFAPFDVNRPVSAAGLPDGSTVVAVTDAATITVSQPATADGTGLTLTIGAP